MESIEGEYRGRGRGRGEGGGRVLLLTISNSKTLQLQLKRAPSARNVEELMGQHSVMSLASGTVNNVLKLYLYAMEVFINLLLSNLFPVLPCFFLVFFLPSLVIFLIVASRKHVENLY